ncbi:MAG: hypothetical protein KA369_08870 [Spirochaetes bacterium]|nr:hypothetical protein [Spirochaetota bacterium]
METTLYIQNDIFQQITKAARIKEISRSAMISILLKKVMNETKNPDCLWKMVHYQQKRKPEEWHRFHFVMRPDDYEYFLDLRKLLKMSVSLILAYAVNKYLHKLLSKNITDNYRYQNYIIIKNNIDTIPSWTLVWGYPPNISDYLQKHTTNT